MQAFYGPLTLQMSINGTTQAVRQNRRGGEPQAFVKASDELGRGEFIQNLNLLRRWCGQ